MAFEIRRYRTTNGDEPFTDWLSALPDRQARARALVRLEIGNFGDSKYLRDGVSELRIDWVPSLLRPGRRDDDRPALRRRQAQAGR